MESGIPVIVALKGNATGHAVLFVGHENIADGLRTGAIYRSTNVGSGVVDTGDASRNSLLLFAHAGIMYLRIQGVYKEVATGFADFPCYKNNLKGEWSRWKT